MHHCKKSFGNPFSFFQEIMWSDLPFGVLAYIFSFLSPDSLACSKSVCRNWREAAKYLVSSEIKHHHRAWFIAYPIRNRDHFCYAYTPVDKNWYMLPLDFIPNQPLDFVRNPTIRPISALGGLILLKLTSTAALQLAICNPFTSLFRLLPELNVRRKNPAVGVEWKSTSNFKFKIYVAGGMSDTASAGAGAGASYEPTVEMYDSGCDKWEIIGSMQMEFAVRLTVWTPNESVCSNGVLYWMTSARVYSVVGFEIGTREWRELSVPMAHRLEFAALVPRNGKLNLIGGKCGGNGCIWELGENDGWSMIERVPHELGMRFLGGKGCWDGTKCVGTEGVVCLYRDLASGMLIWKEEADKNKCEWNWIEGCCSIGGKQLQNAQISGLLLHPNLALSPLSDTTTT